jgi:hypothetical protein
MQILSRWSRSRSESGHRGRALALSVLVIGGCSSFSPSDTGLPEGAIPMEAPPEYLGWFAKTESCSALRGQFQSLQWFVVPNVEAFPTQEGPKVGMWEKSGNSARIVVAGRYTGHEMVIRHEILHHLLDREGHPSEYFVDRCQLTWDTWATNADQ